MKIKLTNGGHTIIDKKDKILIKKYKWLKTSHNYVATTTSPIIYMHRLINNTPKGFITDHINRNTMDNRRKNLRDAKKGLNAINTELRKTNTSGYKGVSFAKNVKKWEAYIGKDYRKISLGFFYDINKAVNARNRAEKLLWGNIQ